MGVDCRGVAMRALARTTDIGEGRDQITYGQSQRSLVVAEKKKTQLVLGSGKKRSLSLVV